MAQQSSVDSATPEQHPGERPDQLSAVSERLVELLGAALDGGVTQLSSGASRATFALSTEAHGRLVLQMDRHAARAEQSSGQAALLTAASRAGVPVAEVIAHGTHDAVLGASWIVVAAVDGSTDPGEIIARAQQGARERLIDSIAAALAAVHRMPADPMFAAPVEHPLASLREQFDALAQPHPVFELAFRALGADQPAPRRAFVHGDFRMGNLIVRDSRVSAVLDWELAHLGDPLEDLGWLCVPAWRFTRPDRPAAGLGTREELAAAYERHAGVEVDRDALRRWELAGTLRWGVICVMQAFTHLSGAINSVEHAVIGRRACEVEWDLLEMLSEPHAEAGPTPPPPASSGAAGLEPAGLEPAPALHDRPTADELLAAARSALGENVLPLLEGRAAFELRVALRAVGMVRREIGLTDAHAALRARALARLGVCDEAELAGAIRGGALDGRAGDLREALRELVRAKLEVANPRYLEHEIKAEEG